MSELIIKMYNINVSIIILRIIKWYLDDYKFRLIVSGDKNELNFLSQKI